jgi:hypothetical protein
LEQVDRLKAMDLTTNPGRCDLQHGSSACGGGAGGHAETSTTSPARI